MYYEVGEKNKEIVELFLRSISKVDEEEIDFAVFALSLVSGKVAMGYSNANAYDLMKASNHIQLEATRKFMEVNYPLSINDANMSDEYEVED